MGGVVLIPKLYASNYFKLGCFITVVFFAGFSVLFNPNEFGSLEKLFRGVSTGFSVILLGMAGVWLRRKWPWL
ncbi:MAG: hypothetical protein HY066_11440 [Betaproteobacteria bacterium]|nr:hypothetical protein [Betaproteobacteria bacterium]